MIDLVSRPEVLPRDYGNANPAAQAIVDVDGRLDDVDTSSLLTIKDADVAPSAFLPFLAWEAGVDVWNAAWTDDIKRAVIKASPIVKRHKGTRYAVEQALGSFGLSTTIVEWWQATPRAKPYTFEITAFVNASPMGVTGPFLSDALIADAYGAVLAAKRHSTAFSMRVAASMPAALGLAPVAVARSRVAVAAHPAPVHEDFRRPLGLAPVAVARSRVAVAAHPAPVAEDLTAGIGLAAVAVGRVRISALLNASP